MTQLYSTDEWLPLYKCEVRDIGQRLAVAAVGRGVESKAFDNLAFGWDRLTLTVMRAGQTLRTKLAIEPAATAAGIEIPEPIKLVGATVNARMIDVRKRNPESVAWSAQQWADCLHCSKSAVAESRTWKALKLVKANEQFHRAKPKDRRRK